MTMLSITHLGAHGDGIAGVQYIPGGVPGDHVEIDENGTIVKVLHGPNHAVPACIHFGTCGGCALQHVGQQSYTTWVRDRILMALTQHSIVPRIVHPPHISPPTSRRRASLKAICKGKIVLLGYNRRGSHELIDLKHCPVLADPIVAIFTPLRKLLPDILKDRGTASIEITACDEGLDMIISGVPERNYDRIARLIAFAQTPGHHIARLSIDAGDGLETFIENSAPTLKFDGIAVRLPPGAFSQATPQAELAMIEAVKTSVGDSCNVADLFCGFGTFALPLSEKAKVYAVDAAQPPVQALQEAARLYSRRLTTQHRDLFRRPLTASELAGFDAVVFDPPRAGAEAQCRALASSDVKTVVAVSCNPNTFARDAKILITGGYDLETIWPIGQFLWSLHVELVALFQRD